VGCVATWGDHHPHCGAVLHGSPCVLPRGHRGPTVHVFGTPGVLDQLTHRQRSVVVKVDPV
jgi:hypothetical protein